MWECVLYINMFYTVPDLGQMRPCASKVMRPLTWAQKEVDPVVLHRQSTLSLCLELLQNNTFKFKIASHKQKSTVKKLIGRKMGPPSPLANGALCLSTPKHNDKSGTGFILIQLL